MKKDDKRIILLKLNNSSVFFRKIKQYYNIKKYYSTNNSLLMYFINKFNLYKYIIGNWKFKIKDNDTFILSDNGYNSVISKYIKKKNKNAKVIFYFWNIVNKYNIKAFDDENIDEFWTFDKKDAKKYNIRFNPQFYTRYIKLKNKRIENDICFLGMAKDRKDFILSFEKKANNLKLKTDFKIIDKAKDSISYTKYIEMVSKTKALLDINDNNQIGLTLRVMEALFLEKKLITNNLDVINYSFYNSNNIFVIGRDNIEKLKEFINSPYMKIEDDIINYYDFENWRDRFINKERDENEI